MAEFLFTPSPHDEAAAFIKDKPALSRDVFTQLLPELQARAFTIAGIEAADVLQRSRDLVAELPAGGDWNDIKKRLVTELSPHFVDKSATDEDQAKQRRGAERRAELLIRTHGQQAYAATQFSMLDEQRAVFPFWQYITLGDDHVRPTHAALDKIILPADHEFWQSHFPPWEFNCRCQCVPLTRADVERQKEREKDKPVDHREVLPDFALKDLAESRRLVRNGVSYDVSSPRERGKPGAYSFNPHDLRISIDTLKARYDATTFATFEAWATKQKLPGGEVTVWDWLGGFAPPPAPGGWPKLDRLQVVRALGGSTGAELVRDPASGRLYVRKRGASPEHLREEALADGLYSALGVPVPPSKIFETEKGPVKLAEFVEGQTMAEALKGASAARRKKLIAAAGEHFAADALLGNWDVAGLGMDNLLVDEAGQVWRIDNGGALRFRAQGAPKGDDWNAFPTELWTLRDAAKNPASAKLFGSLDIYQLARQIETLDPVALAEAPAELRAVMEARLGHLRAVAAKALDMEHDAWKPGYSDSLTRHMMGMRAAGVFDTLSAKLIQKAGTVNVVDENGLAWDHLRAHKGAAAAPVTDPFYSPLLAAVKSLNNHGVKGDFKFNSTTVELALKQKSSLQFMAKDKKSEFQAMAKHYLGTIKEIERAASAAKAGKFHQIPTFAAHTETPAKPAAPAGSAASVVERFADYCKAQGLSNAPASDWMNAQAGSSWNADARAYKHFVADQLTLTDDAHYWGPSGKAGCAADWAKFAGKHGAKVTESLIARHALVQEVLGRVEMRYNDQTRRTVRLCRTENATLLKAQKVTKGAARRMLRGANESSSIFRQVNVKGSEVTLQAVPHSRVTGLFLLERDPGQANGSFLGDGENEFTIISAGIPFDYPDSVSFAGGSDAAKWDLDLKHLRNP
jgi:SPP1 gp7 family putative phage head morphogenesis protein